MVDVNPHAYNSAWQFRADTWCRLEEASLRVSHAAAQGRIPRRLSRRWRACSLSCGHSNATGHFPVSRCSRRCKRQFADGGYDTFGRTVAKMNRALVTESYRAGAAASPWRARARP